MRVDCFLSFEFGGFRGGFLVVSSSGREGDISTLDVATLASAGFFCAMKPGNCLLGFVHHQKLIGSNLEVLSQQVAETHGECSGLGFRV